MKKDVKEILEDEATKSIASKWAGQMSERDFSVRTTFSLTEDGKAAVLWMKRNYRKNIKSIIDNLCEQLRNVSSEADELSLGQILISLVKNSSNTPVPRIRQSMVLSKKSLDILNQVAKNYGISRDEILDKGFYLMMQLLKDSDKMRLDRHRKALRMINNLWRHANNVEKELQKFLDDSDPVFSGLGAAIVHLMNTSIALEKEQKEGTPIDPDEI